MILDARALMHIMLVYDLFPQADGSHLRGDRNRDNALDVLYRECGLPHQQQPVE